MIAKELAEFVQSGVAVHIGTRDAELQPEGARALGASVEADGRHLIVYVSEAAARRILPNLEANGQAAVVFARPTDDRACQIKGHFAGARTATVDEQPRIAAHWKLFFANMARIGIPRVTAAGWPTWPAIAIRIRATAVFDQTPGPQAGTALA
jgi:hypothetical protein